MAASSASTVWQANTTIEFAVTPCMMGGGERCLLKKGSEEAGRGPWQLLKHLICWNLARHVSLLTATVCMCVCVCECVFMSLVFLCKFPRSDTLRASGVKASPHPTYHIHSSLSPSDLIKIWRNMFIRSADFFNFKSLF